MPVEPPWVKVSQSACEQIAFSLEQPLWLKMSLLAWARVPANGHARFQRGELVELMDGKCRQDIVRAIRVAIDKGFLHEGSCTECLMPPGDFVEMSWGNGRKVCDIHTEGRKINRGQTETCWSEEFPEALSASDVSTQCLQRPALSAYNGELTA